MGIRLYEEFLRGRGGGSDRKPRLSGCGGDPPVFVAIVGPPRFELGSPAPKAGRIPNYPTDPEQMQKSASLYNFRYDVLEFYREVPHRDRRHCLIFFQQ